MYYVSPQGIATLGVLGTHNATLGVLGTPNVLPHWRYCHIGSLGDSNVKKTTCGHTCGHIHTWFFSEPFLGVLGIGTPNVLPERPTEASLGDTCGSNTLVFETSPHTTG